MPEFTGTSGDDVFTGGDDYDFATGGAGADKLSGENSDDVLTGDSGADVLNGGEGQDVLFSDALGDDLLYPYSNNRVFDTGAERDTLIGGAGRDHLVAGFGDNVDGGEDVDTLSISFMGATSGVIADFRLDKLVIGGGTIKGIEALVTVQGSNFNDYINANLSYPYGAGVNTLLGMGGNDEIVASYYTVKIDGGDGNDTLDGRSSEHLYQLTGGAGDDTLYSNNGAYVYGDAGDDVIYAGCRVSGGDGDDLIILHSPVNYGPSNGDAGDDEIRASSAGSAIGGGDGADTLLGAEGADRLVSGNISTDHPYEGLDDMRRDYDVLSGGGGDDRLWAGYGDSVDGGDGVDTLSLSLGGSRSGVVLDTSSVTSGNPFTLAGGVIRGVEALVYLRGSEFADVFNIATQSSAASVVAGEGDDVVTANGSAVSLSGGAGSDSFVSGTAADRFDGGAGVDTVDYSRDTSSVTVNLATGRGARGDTLLNVENVTGTALNDVLTGDGAANQLRGLTGADTLNGGAGADVLEGGSGDDIYHVDNAADVVTEAKGEGTDLIIASASFVMKAGSYVENLTLSGTSNLNATGNGVANVITGNAGKNVLDGGKGDDVLIGGRGDDTCILDSSADQVRENQGEGVDTIVATFSYTLTAGLNVENLTLTGSGDLNGAGDDFNNVITGNAGANALTGGKANDTLNGGAGVDTLKGGVGDDTYHVDSNSDVVTEKKSEGTDLILASVSFAMKAGSYVENLTLTGTSNIDGAGNGIDNVITGNAGNNILDGGKGNDTLIGGLGVDTLKGGDGDDAYYVDNSADLVLEAKGAGDDRVFASISYTLAAGSYVETLFLTGTADLNATGNGAGNTLIGNRGANILDGGKASDTLIGGLGDDTYHVDSNSDVVTEKNGEGTDLIISSVNFVMKSGSYVENLTLTGSGNLNGTGNGIDNVITGNAGNNVLDGGKGNDTLIGGAGADTLKGGVGDDIYYVDSSTDVVLEAKGAGDDRVFASVSYTLAAGSYVETLILTGTTDLNATGNGVANIITGNAGNNILDGGKGNDTLTGGLGDDTYYVDSSGDVVVEGEGGGTDLIVASFSFVLKPDAFIENLTLSGSENINGTGDENDNIITGNAGANVLTGVAGDDILNGGADGDTLKGGAGDDFLDGGAGADTMEGGAGDDTYYVDDAGDVVIEGAGDTLDIVAASVSYTLTNGNIEALVLTGTGAINGTGNSGDNVIVGNAGANTLNGGAGVDILSGGSGADTLTGGSGTDVFVFAYNSDSTNGTPDRITDLSGDDYIDLTGVVGSTLYLTDSFTGGGNEIRLSYDNNANTTSLTLDINGDKVADMTIHITGDHDDFTNFIFGGG